MLQIACGIISYLFTYLANRTEDGKLDDEDFKMFLDRTIAFIWGYAIMHPGVNALRTPIFAEMLNIVNLNEVTFSDFKLIKSKHAVRSLFMISKTADQSPNPCWRFV